ncbi:hypothetical protein CHS0354_038455 [Potamilus streckersoni]|uniref:Uncharacterized protein n=1 Tax=Potamilus streckersoni TaxID=2493646 RepID=A0AAE0S628_9BIVA|nr:hypothetical protein CHS0354_038455 [Potamilus streckersoni]
MSFRGRTRRTTQYTSIEDIKRVEIVNHFIDYSKWIQFLNRKARIEAEFSYKASEWTKDVQKYMDSLSSETWAGLEKMKTMASHHVSHFRETAEFFAKSAKIDKEAANNMRELVSTNQTKSTDLLECREALNRKINYYLRCKTDIEKQTEKVDTAIDRLKSLASEMAMKEPNKRQRKAEIKCKSAIQKYQDLILMEGEMRENLLSLSGLYEQKAFVFACSEVDTFLITWKKFYLQYVGCASLLSKKTE